MINTDVFDEVEEYFSLGVVVRPGDVVFDVGANIGCFAEAAAIRGGGRVSLFCFEPLPPIFTRLERQFRLVPMLRDSPHRLLNVALGDRSAGGPVRFNYFRRLPTDSTRHLRGKRTQFQAAFDSAGAAVGLHCQGRLPEPVGTWVGDRLSHLVASLPHGKVGEFVSDLVTGRRQYDCQVKTFADVVRDYEVERINLLKVDVEGAELEVLRGGDVETFRRVSQVVLEGHSTNDGIERARSLLVDRGLRVHRVVRPQKAARRGLDNFLMYASRRRRETH